MRLVRVILVSAALVFATLGAASGTALAYGKADGPIAQIELSANCVSPSFPLCDPDGVGTGGRWLRTEIDSGWTADYTGAGGGHTIGGPGGPGDNYGDPLKGEATWSYTTLEAVPDDVWFFGTFDPSNSYYLVTYAFGESWLYPTTPGHYAVKLAPGVVLQLTVAPAS